MAVKLELSEDAEKGPKVEVGVAEAEVLLPGPVEDPLSMSAGEVNSSALLGAGTRDDVGLTLQLTEGRLSRAFAAS